MDDRVYVATPHDELIRQLMDSCVPKTEREHAACREIERMRVELAECRREHLANIEYAVSCLGQIYGMLDEGRLDQAEDFCRGAAETFTQDIDALAAGGE